MPDRTVRDIPKRAPRPSRRSVTVVRLDRLHAEIGEELGGGGVGGVLRDEAAGDGGGEDGVPHALEELADGAEPCLAGVELGERLLDRRDDALLLSRRRHR